MKSGHFCLKTDYRIYII